MSAPAVGGFRSGLQVKLACPWANDGTGQWELLVVLSFYSAVLRRLIEVPVGFSTDFASVPKGVLAWGLFGGRYAMAAVIHDYLLREGYVRREKCDRVFLEAMQVLNAEEIAAMRNAGIDEDEVLDRKAGLEGRAQMMYKAVWLHTKTLGLFTTLPDYKQPGYEPIG